MIRDVLAPVLQKEFAGQGIVLSSDSNVVATFPALHPQVGDVTVWDDGGEVTVGIGEITHTHFEAAEESMSSSAIAQQITADVVAFLRNLFADRILFWKARSGKSAGLELVEGNLEDVPKDPSRHWFVWSSPLR
jgi:hypothetical protein